MGNLEQPLTDDTGTAKCGAPTVEPNCFQFRAPPSYAAHLRDAGFELLNQANNHGQRLRRRRVTATPRRRWRSTGSSTPARTDQITVVDVKGVKVAVLGFSSYAGATA